MIEVRQCDDGSLDISWDPNDPEESKLNDWTEQDFINAIQNKVLTIQDQSANLEQVQE